MLILNSKKINQKFVEIIEYSENVLNLPKISCPNCKSSNIIKYGNYKRNIIYLENNTYENVCNSYNTDIRIISRLNKQFLTIHRSRCLTTFENENISMILKDFINNFNSIEFYIKQKNITKKYHVY